MAKAVIKRGRKTARVMWNAFRKAKDGTEQRYIMRSDYAVLYMKLEANGNSTGWVLDHRHELDMGAFRKRLVGLGFIIGRGGELPAEPKPEVGQEVSRIPTLSEIINSQPELVLKQPPKKGTRTMTQHNLKILSAVELVALYNKATGKSIKRFANRAAGERLTLAALSAPAGTSAARAARKAKTPVAKPEATLTAPSRKVNGTAGGKSKVGRPVIPFIITLSEADKKANLQKNSARQKVVDWLKEQKGGSATIAQLEEKFGDVKNIRAVVAKLVATGWAKMKNS